MPQNDHEATKDQVFYQKPSSNECLSPSKNQEFFKGKISVFGPTKKESLDSETGITEISVLPLQQPGSVFSFRGKESVEALLKSIPDEEHDKIGDQRTNFYCDIMDGKIQDAGRMASSMGHFFRAHKELKVSQAFPQLTQLLHPPDAQTSSSFFPLQSNFTKDISGTTTSTRDPNGGAIIVQKDANSQQFFRYGGSLAQSILQKASEIEGATIGDGTTKFTISVLEGKLADVRAPQREQNPKQNASRFFPGGGGSLAQDLRQRRGGVSR